MCIRITRTTFVETGVRSNKKYRRQSLELVKRVNVYSEYNYFSAPRLIKTRFRTFFYKVSPFHIDEHWDHSHILIVKFKFMFLKQKVTMISC